MPNNQSLKPVDRRSFLKSSAAITATLARCSRNRQRAGP